jgi:hypothetical protein
MIEATPDKNNFIVIKMRERERNLEGTTQTASLVHQFWARTLPRSPAALTSLGITRNNLLIDAKIEVLVAITAKNIFWYVKPCDLAEVYGRFG